jgi:mannose/fructose/N-acetylgalactosamine-specific phosphotransferase system component IID
MDGTLVARSLALQAAFNPANLQGAGFAHALVPVLARVHGREAGGRAAALAENFNANPFLATFALGAVAAVEGKEPPQRIDRFVKLVRAPLGSLGDALFWSAARPALFVPAALAVIAGAPWWLAFAVTALFNVVSFAARFTGARAGLARGLDVAAALASSWIRRAPVVIRPVGALIVGLTAGVALVRTLVEGGWSQSITGSAPGAAPAPAWLALAIFASSVPVFAFWPRRLGWGLALIVGWVAAAGLTSWAVS